MPSPYNLDIQEHCTTCTYKKEGLFCNLAPASLATLDALKFTSLYPKGSLLFVEGEQPRGVFIVCSGKAKLTTSSAEGKTLIVKIAGAGEILGASASLLDTPYEVSAETIEPSQTIAPSRHVSWPDDAPERTRSRCSPHPGTGKASADRPPASPPEPRAHPPTLPNA